MVRQKQPNLRHSINQRGNAGKRAGFGRILRGGICKLLITISFLTTDFTDFTDGSPATSYPCHPEIRGRIPLVAACRAALFACPASLSRQSQATAEAWRQRVPFGGHLILFNPAAFSVMALRSFWPWRRIRAGEGEGATEYANIQN
jgi:hypothetical protein